MDMSSRDEMNMSLKWCSIGKYLIILSLGDLFRQIFGHFGIGFKYLKILTENQIFSDHIFGKLLIPYNSLNQME